MSSRSSTRTVRKTRWTAIVAAAVMGVVFAMAGASFADDISNNLDATIDAAAEAMPLNVGGANGTTQLFVTPRNGDGKNGCNLTSSTTLVLAVASSHTSVATVSPSSVTFTSCGDLRVLTVTPVAQGTATISVSQTSNDTGGTFNLAPATFTVNVAPPANSAPTVAVAGVVGGASYNKGSVPAATCQVTDAEDGNSSFAATLSAIAGPYASDGIGSQTASCSYTDGGGLTASGSETYSIVDPSPPTIASTLNPASPDGLNGWYKSNVTLTWTVTEPQSPNSVEKTGCVDQNITTDQAATPYSCSVTSAGGSAGPSSVTIKRDATVPTVSNVTVLSNGSPYTAGSWTNHNVTVSWDCSDITSGAVSNTGSQTLVSETEVGSVTPTCSDNAGNTATAAAVSPIKIDKTAPTGVSTSLDRAADNNGWYNASVGWTTTGTDTLSDIASCSSGTYSGPDGTGKTVSGTCTDHAGNTSTAAASPSFKYDATAPTGVSTSLDRVADHNGWYTAAVGWTTSGTDDTSGIDSCSSGTYSGPDGGGKTVSGSCTDDAGNTSAAAASASFDYDASAPTGVATSLDRVADHGGWYNAAVDWTTTGTDTASGIDSCSSGTYSGPDGGGKTVSGTCTDNAGNTSAAAVSASFKYDATDPTSVSTSLNRVADHNGWYNASVDWTTSGSDDTSGIDSCSSGTYSGPDGTGKTVSGSCTDNAGNTSAAARLGFVQVRRDRSDERLDFAQPGCRS